MRKRYVYGIVMICCFLLVAGGCRKAPPTEEEIQSEFKRVRTNLSAALVEVRSLNDEQLKKKLFAKSPEMPPLRQLVTEPEEVWLWQITAFTLLEYLWDSLGMYAIDDGSREFGLTEKKLPEDVAKVCLLRTEAFAELCRRKHEAAWEFLLERSSEETSVLDVCVFGWIASGTSFPLLAPEGGAKIDPFHKTREIHPSGEPLASGSSEERWVTLADGKNGAYSLLGMVRLFSFAEDSKEKMLAILERAMDHDFLVVRQEYWYSLVKELPDDERKEMYREYLRRAAEREYKTDLEREASEDFIKRLKRRLPEG